LYERQALTRKASNFQQRLISPQSDLAEKTMKDPYMFDFIQYREGMIEREIEKELVKNITKLLLELGTGFAFLGNQYHIEVENEDFFIEYSDSRFIPILSSRSQKHKKNSCVSNNSKKIIGIIFMPIRTSA
jgi:predicted nuclease of restriction endonuclease-like (RecB) superfamily